ncbi:unnamed protein product [Ectocarpus sp. 4 AP-2014]
MPSLIKKRSHGGDTPGAQHSTLKMRRSCDACALAKRRCDGELRCSLCCKKSIHCVYSTRQKSGPKGHKAPEESVAATATTSISSMTTTDKPIKRRKTSTRPSKKQASAAAAPSTTTGWHHQRQQSSLLKTVPPGKSELITPASLAPSPTAAVVPASPSLSKMQQPAAAGRRHPSQQVARKEPRPRNHRKDEDGKKIPAVKSPAPAAAAATAVVSPSNGTSRFPRQQPLAPALPAQFPSLSRSKSSAAEETAVAKFAPLPRMVPRRGSSVSAPGSESSVDGRSSSLSWDDVQDVFVSSLEDDVLWSCDDFSDDDRAEGWAADGVASDDGSPGGFDWVSPNVEKNATPSNDSPKALEAILMAGEQEPVLTTDQTATTAAPRPAGRFAGQPPPSALAPQESRMYQVLPSRASSPSVVFAQRSPGAGGGESSGGLPISAIISEDVQPIVVNVLPAVSGRGSSSSGMLQNSFGGISDSKAAACGDGACSPISTWTPEAVVAGASTLLAVLSDADFCSSVRSDILTGDNGWGVKRRHQQHQHEQQQQPNDDSSMRWSWPPRNLRANYGMVPRSPPAATPTLVADGSWQFETTGTDGPAVSEKNRGNYYHRQQQQQQQQRLALALAPPDIRSLVKELSTPSDGGGTAARGGKGSKRYRTATL